jgi:hypothetical protein
MIVASANPIAGDARVPSFSAGHGAVDLTTVIDQGLRFANSVEIGDGECVSYRFQVTDRSKPLRIAMAYLDEPTTVRKVALVADLDLVLKMPDGRIVFGNMRKREREERFATVEKILLWERELAMGVYEVTIVPHGDFALVSKLRVSFSLVVIGPIDPATAFEESRERVQPCTDGLIGSACQIRPMEIAGDHLALTIAAASIEYFVVKKEHCCRECRVIVARSPSDSAQFQFLFQMDALPLTAIEYEIMHEKTGAELEFSLAPFENVSEYLGMAVVNCGRKDFGLYLWIDGPDVEMAVPRMTRSPRVVPPSYYTPMMAAYGLLGACALAIFILLACMLARRD